MAISIASLVRRLVDVLLPPTCAACRGLVDAAPICAECAAALRALPVPAPLLVPIPASEGAWLEAHALLPFMGPVRPLVLALKYQGRKDAARALAEVAAWRRGEELRSTVLVPIPLHPRRERSRGYNQSAILAAAIASATDARVEPHLIRVRATRSQTRLGRNARAGNVAGAFAMTPGAKNLDLARPVILVDDVVTTGATLSAAAAVLRAVGAQRLSALTGAREI